VTNALPAAAALANAPKELASVIRIKSNLIPTDAFKRQGYKSVSLTSE